MPRTIISLSQEDKIWLDDTAKEKHVSMTEIVRQAIAKYRKNYKPKKPSTLEKLLHDTSGIYKKGDSVTYVRKLREEWDK